MQIYGFDGEIKYGYFNHDLSAWRNALPAELRRQNDANIENFIPIFSTVRVREDANSEKTHIEDEVSD